MLDHWLDEYEARWHQGATPPSLLEFVAALPEPERGPHTVRELALVDLERRWRRFFAGASTPEAPPVVGLSTLPTWAEYCRLLPGCELTWVEGIGHEFRVRQAFGDRPHYRQSIALYPTVAEELARRLPDIAAEETRAVITLVQDGREHYCGCLPGRLEVGRRRVHEPPVPALLAGSGSSRLLIADLQVTYISRLQCRLEVVAKDRLLVQHLARKGSVACSAGKRLSREDSCEVELPCLLDFHGRRLRIARDPA